MSEQLTARFRTTLAQEVENWKLEGLVSEETAAQIITRYPLLSKRSGLITGLTILGAVLVGLGTLLFVGANWDVIPKLFKLLLILTVMTASYGSGWFCTAGVQELPAAARPATGAEPETKGHPRLGAALLLLGNIFYGAGIWLTGQMFNLDMDIRTGLLLWGAGSAAMTLVTRQTAMASLSAILFALWVVAGEFQSAVDILFRSIPQNNLVNFTLAFAGSLALSHVVRSRAAAIITLVTGCLWVLICSGAHVYALALYGTALYLSSLWYRKRSALFADTFMYTGALATAIAFFIITFDRVGSTSGGHISAFGGTNFLNMGLLLAASIAVGAIAYFKARASQLEVGIGMGAAVAACTLSVVAGDTARSLMTNVSFVALLASMIYIGLRTNRTGLVNVAMVFVVLDIVARYFDFFYSMMDRSVFFIMGGVVLMVAGAVVEKNRRRLVNRTA